MANTRERVKDFPLIVGTIQSDDYFPVDGVTQGVRKAQVSDIMNAPLSGLATAANTVKGAINEVATTAGKQDSMTQDEYNALPSSKESDNVARYITDGTPSTEDPLWAKVGTDRLDTEAPDCSGAINELKQSLSVKETTPSFNTQAITDSASDPSFIQKSGNTVTVFLNFSASATVTAWSTLIGTLPSGYRPPKTIFPLGKIGNNIATLRVGSDGGILSSVGMSSGNSANISFTFMTS